MALPYKNFSVLSLLFFLFISFHSHSQIDKRLNAYNLLYDGYVAMDEGDSSLALEYFSAVAPNDTGYFLANYFCYSIYNGFKNYEKSLELSNIGLENYKTRESDFFIQKGNSLAKLDRYSEALEVYEKAIEKYPFNHILHYNRALAFKELENYDAYLESLKKAISIYPYYAPAHRELGFAAEGSGKITQALMSFVMSILVDPTSDVSNPMLVHIDELVTDKFKVDKDAHTFNFEGDEYDEIDLMIRNYVALQKGYKAKSKAKLALVKQLQLMMEQLEYNAKDQGYWMKTYVRFYTKLWDEDYFESFSYYILKASQNSKHQKLVRRKAKKIEKFAAWGGDEINSYFNTLPIEIEGKEFLGVRVYGAHGKSALSSISKRKNGQVDGPIYNIHSSGALRSKGQIKFNGKAYGTWKWYNERGEIDREYELKNGLLEGVYKVYYSNGELSEKINFKKDERDGIYESYFVNGGISSRQEYKNGIRDGKMLFFFKNGNIEYKFNRVENEIEGTLKRFYPDGQLRFIQSYTKSEKDSIGTEYYWNGNLRSRMAYKENELDGPYEEYFISGKLERKGTYVEGSQSGENLDYWFNGNLYQKNIYDQDGKKNGLSQEFARDGSKYLEFDFKKGNIIAYRIFDKSGKIVKTAKKKGGDFLYEGLYPDGTKSTLGLYDSKGGKEGLWEFYDKNGKLETASNYEKGVLEGKSVSYYPSGELRGETEYEEGQWNGMGSSYYINGQLRYEVAGEKGYAERQKVYHNAFGDTTDIEFYYQGDQSGWQYSYAVTGKLDYKLYMVSGTTVLQVKYDTNGIPIDTLNFYGKKTFETFYPNGQKEYNIPYVNGQAHGLATWYYGNGQISKKGEFKFGEEEGLWTNYFPNGEKSLEYRYENGSRNGKTTRYHENGKIAETYNYLYGNLDGLDTYYNEEGIKTNIYNYEMGLRNGIAKFHDPSGKLDHVRYYSYGKIIGYSYEGKDGKLVEMIPIKDETAEVKSYFSNGKVGREYHLAAGEFDKAYIEYYSNGQISEVSNYKNGSREGEFLKYYKNSKLKEKGQYENDEAVGHHFEYYSNGTMKSDKKFLKGVLHGESKFYSKSGNLVLTRYYYNGDLISEKSA
tara:strand:- start:137716 stop:141018 length:3303 start_codon:yes stop_codon:yes gene_type:complete